VIVQSNAYSGMVSTCVVAEVTKNLTMASDPACLFILKDAFPAPIHLGTIPPEVPMQTIALSESALALLRQHAEHDGVPLTDENREAHRELARAGLMVVGHDFLAGHEAFYRLTRTGWKLADFLERMPNPTAPSPAESGAPRP
jgi:hypothetical protein